jgi:hypothetical protein
MQSGACLPLVGVINLLRKLTTLLLSESYVLIYEGINCSVSLSTSGVFAVDERRDVPSGVPFPLYAVIRVPGCV